MVFFNYKSEFFSIKINHSDAVNIDNIGKTSWFFMASV